MYRKLLISLCLIGLTTATVTVDASQHCDCSELNQTDCAFALAYCVWNQSDSECMSYTFGCSDLTTQVLCDAAGSCKWNSGSCEDWDPSCSDGTTADLCNDIDGCYWNKSNACASFSACADYSTDNCPSSEWCSVTSGACANYSFVTCSTQTQATCQGYDTKTTRCAWANDSSCKSLARTFSACSDYNNFTSECNNQWNCVYDGSACRARKCSDASIEALCTSINTGDTTYSLCSWSNNACADAADTSALTKDNCYSKTLKNYKWSSDNKCVACDDLVDNSDSSNSVILGAFVLLALIA